MLDETNLPVDDLPQPPTGRRSRTRPAGPPEPEHPLFSHQNAPAPESTDGTQAATKPARRRTTSAPKKASGTAENQTKKPSRPQPASQASEAEAKSSPVAAKVNPPSRKTGKPTKASDPEALAHLAEAIADSPNEANSPKRRRPEKIDEPTTSDEPKATEAGETSPAPRRRRRGGRRRRKSGFETETNEPENTETSQDQPAPAAPPATDNEAGDDSTAGHRRRRRRRRGESVEAADDDPAEVVVKVREPRKKKSDKKVDEVSGIDGSTRVEAKRKRRREGRSAGHRAPILTEAEFLARRESVERVMVIRQGADCSQIAVLEDGVLVEHYVDRPTAASLIGSIYLGKVQNVLPSMEAAFIDIGRGRNAVLYSGEVDWEIYGEKGVDHKVEEALIPGQSVLVQVSKDPVGAKGARLTAHVSLPGRYVVYSPEGQLSGISRKLPDNERKRLKEALGQILDDEASVIIRTAAEGASQDELVHDVERLKAQWDVIKTKVEKGDAPQQLYAEPDLMLRIVRDLFTEDFRQLIVAGAGGQEDAFETVDAYVRHVAPHLVDRLVRWDSDSQGDPFAQHRIDEQISKALERKVFLPSGGSLVIDRTEAMTVIDVNTGKFVGTGGNLEETVTRNNLEAAEEIVRQLRLRDLGGIIVIDFIDMVLPDNRELLLRRLVECLSRDRTRHQVSEVTSLGLVQMTRKKIGTGLSEAFTEACYDCGGRGYIRHNVPVPTQSQADGGDRKKRKAKPKLPSPPSD